MVKVKAAAVAMNNTGLLTTFVFISLVNSVEKSSSKTAKIKIL